MKQIFCDQMLALWRDFWNLSSHFVLPYKSLKEKLTSCGCKLTFRRKSSSSRRRAFSWAKRLFFSSIILLSLASMRCVAVSSATLSCSNWSCHCTFPQNVINWITQDDDTKGLKFNLVCKFLELHYQESPACTNFQFELGCMGNPATATPWCGLLFGIKNCLVRVQMQIAKFLPNLTFLWDRRACEGWQGCKRCKPDATASVPAASLLGLPLALARGNGLLGPPALVPPPFQNQIGLPQRSATVNVLHQSTTRTEQQEVAINNLIAISCPATVAFLNGAVVHPR